MASIINALTASGGGVAISGDATGNLALQSAGNTAVTINTSQGVQFKNTIGVGDATPSTSGAGITFPATQSASSDANTLDDYEEGTWTPSFGGGGSDPTVTYGGDRIGRYTKIGNLVYVSARLPVATVSGGSGVLLIRGLPFTLANDTTFPAFPLGYKVSFVTNGPDYARFLSNGTNAEIYKSNNTGETQISPANLQVGTDVIFSGCYRV